MSTKEKPGEFDCYKRALPNEPMFVLLARDPVAPQLIMMWAQQRARDINRGERPGSDAKIVTEAMDVAQAMIKWRMENNGKWHEDSALKVQPETDPAREDGSVQLDVVFQADIDGVKPFPAFLELVRGDVTKRVGVWMRRPDNSVALRISTADFAAALGAFPPVEAKQ